ncbi:hypothetical protein [Mycobacterium sp. ITM-2016-00318]|uniref:hypothetical protein n=1 Tax=Mycobacterium sp. ITM-2016-00318 TaxID=2099693 RepID=UPI001E45E8AE|nr:hypothetical protein [Mycobacterium sp. ITM-2016-00318]WNG93686.1 hypothetical protein C6A82_004240 [Mycobacterium sp. ITM-2016-00318]
MPTGRPREPVRARLAAGRSARRTSATAPILPREHDGATRQRRQAAARRYRPPTIKLLLVAEAPPPASDRYFYFPEVASHDSLFRNVAARIFGEDPTREGKAELLAQLKARGIFLIDLKEDPVDGAEDLSPYVPSLIERSRALRPEKIILIKANVYDTAYSELAKAGLPVVAVRMPFPGHGRQRQFKAAFAQALEQAGWR